jgi:hypothetical protein
MPSHSGSSANGRLNMREKVVPIVEKALVRCAGLRSRLDRAHNAHLVVRPAIGADV